MMKHSVDDLVGIVRRHYPRGLQSNDPLYEESEEYHRLVAARRLAGTSKEPWCSMLRRLRDRFPENIVQNFSLHLPTGNWDAGYKGAVYLSQTPVNHHWVVFLVSFLAPYYVVYGSRSVEDLEELARIKVQRATPARMVSVGVPDVPDTMFILPACIVKPELIAPDPPLQAYRNIISFNFSPEEQPYASRITEEIEATWQGYERMPPEIGKVIVPDVSTNARELGAATLYDCLFTDNW